MDAAQEGRRKAQRVQAEIAAAAHGQSHPAEAGHRGGKLPQRARGRVDTMDLQRRVGDAVAVMMNGENAGIDLEALLDQDLPGPERAPRDREAGSAIGCHAAAGDLLQDIPPQADVVAELGGRLLVNQAVRETVRGDFVAGGFDLADQRRVPLRGPTENEERRLEGVVLEQGQQPPRVSRDPARKSVPLLARNGGLERGNLKVLFHVDREGVDEFHDAFSGADSRFADRAA